MDPILLDERRFDLWNSRPVSIADSAWSTPGSIPASITLGICIAIVTVRSSCGTRLIPTTRAWSVRSIRGCSIAPIRNVSSRHCARVRVVDTSGSITRRDVVAVQQNYLTCFPIAFTSQTSECVSIRAGTASGRTLHNATPRTRNLHERGTSRPLPVETLNPVLLVQNTKHLRSGPAGTTEGCSVLVTITSGVLPPLREHVIEPLES